MPTAWDPWPGKRKAMVWDEDMMVFLSERPGAPPSPAFGLAGTDLYACAEVIRVEAISSSIRLLILRLAYSAATRIAFLMAFAFELP